VSFFCGFTDGGFERVGSELTSGAKHARRASDKIFLFCATKLRPRANPTGAGYAGGEFESLSLRQRKAPTISLVLFFRFVIFFFSFLLFSEYQGTE